MSLKGFHLFFIFVSILLSVGCAVWAFQNEVAPPFGILASVVAVALVIYGIYFIRKSRSLIV